MNTLTSEQIDDLSYRLEGTNDDHEVVIARMFHCQPPENIVNLLEEVDLHRCAHCFHWCRCLEMSKFPNTCMDCLG